MEISGKALHDYQTLLFSKKGITETFMENVK